MRKIKVAIIFTTWRLLFFFIWKLPMAFLAGLRVKELNVNKCIVSAPYNYLNKNPFYSMYFAIQAMAAELSTGALVMFHLDGRNISMLVTALESKYYKKAVTRINFICLDGEKISDVLNEAYKTNEPKICTMISKGYDLNNNCVSEFKITWSIKKRKNYNK